MRFRFLFGGAHCYEQTIELYDQPDERKVQQARRPELMNQVNEIKRRRNP
jgi:hypothetical protein